MNKLLEFVDGESFHAAFLPAAGWIVCSGEIEVSSSVVQLENFEIVPLETNTLETGPGPIYRIVRSFNGTRASRVPLSL